MFLLSVLKMIHPLALLHSLKSLHFILCYFPLSLWFVHLLSLQLGQAVLNEGFLSTALSGQRAKGSTLQLRGRTHDAI